MTSSNLLSSTCSLTAGPAVQPKASTVPPIEVLTQRVVPRETPVVLYLGRAQEACKLCWR